MRYLLYILVFLSTLVCTALSAQTDTTVQETPTPPAYSSSKGIQLKPRLGLGMGTLVFLGDIGRDNRGYHPGSADLAYTLSVTNELTSYLDLRLYSVFGTININELTHERAMNLQSQIRTGGFALSYNFDHFLPSKRDIDPFVTVGFEAFEFLSKTDLYDANGYRYHYWSDGTIRSLSENAENAQNAIMLQRDYVYETDLRELNLDGNGRYLERSFAIPVGAGIQFKMTDRFRARMAFTYSFGMTDLVDNMTAESTGVRQGDQRNDRFMFTSVSLNYDLNPMQIKKEQFDPLIMDENGNFLANLEDTDKDGVPDVGDKCPGTPEGVEVDRDGCPVDSDNDGFPDYRDAEPNSPHAYVDGEGVAMIDDDIYDRYLMWHDSIAWKGTDPLTENFAKVMSDPSQGGDKVYGVRIARSEVEAMTQDEINLLMSFKDVHEIVGPDGEYFVIGSFSELPLAIQRKLQLASDGIETNLVQSGEQGEYEDVTPSDEMMAQAEEDFAAELASELDGDLGLHYRVQVGAFRYKLNQNIFADMGDVIAVKGGDKLTRYMTRSYDSMEEAANRRVELLLMGFDGAFITAYEGGDRITLSDAGMTVVDESKDVTVDVENNSIDVSKVKYVVQLGSFEGDIPTETLDKLLGFGNVKPRREADGKTYFLSAPCEDLQEANALLDKALALGINSATLVGEFNHKLITVDEAMKMKGDNDTQVYLED
ncbi:SPOR domain-containing protein [Sanyastnella coralliicola]|uniref:SPOR domain-containing protein n=1 Tax=Sanyastnella coralliicola TaxID=3069118 RepID=UPI0027BAF11E|nr:SPOR domain-containing protein [Longitalea sp. SCSIO 12813]